MVHLLFFANLLPDIVWSIILLFSAILLFVIVFVKLIPYRLPIGIASAVVLALSIWVNGSIAYKTKFNNELNELKIEIAKLESKSTERNIDIVEKIVYKDKVIVQKGRDLVKEVEKLVHISGPERVVEIPGPETIRIITKDMSEEQRIEYENEIKRLKEQKNKIEVITKDMSAEQRKIYEDEIAQLRRLASAECHIPKSLIELYNEAATNPTRQRMEKK